MILISACLAGIPCRYDGRDTANQNIIKLLKEGKAIPVCPEQLGGLSTPRIPCEITKNKVINKTGNDLTENFTKGAEIVLDIAKKCNCKTAILKSKSPSCGTGKIYDGTFSGNLINGNGITADLLIANGIEVFTEDNYFFNINP